MRFSRLAGIVLLLGFINGCAYLTSMQGDAELQVDSWIKQHEYGKALDTLGYIKKDHPDYERLMVKREQVALEARIYEKKVVREAEDFISQNRWHDALAIYDQALARLPKSNLLREGKKELYRKQNLRLAELNLDLLVVQAEWLGDSLPVYEAIAEVAPRDRSKKRLVEKKHTEAKELINLLLPAGRDALDRGDLVEARHILSQALRLDPDIASQKVVRELESAEVGQAKVIGRAKVKRDVVRQSGAKQREAELKQIEEMQLAQQRQSEKLFNDYEQAFFDKNFKKAKELLEKLKEMDGANIDLKRRDLELAQAIKSAVKEYLDQGVSLYGQAQFKQAIEVWQKILEIDPGNTLAQSHVDRAQMALDKLRQLREKQKGAGRAP